MKILKGSFFLQEIIEKLFFDYQQTEEYAKEFNSVPKKAEIQMAQDAFVKPAFEKSFEQGDKLDEVLTTALCLSLIHI